MNLILWIKNKRELEHELISLDREINVERTKHTKSKLEVLDLELTIEKLTKKIEKQLYTIKRLKKEINILKNEKNAIISEKKCEKKSK